MYPQVKIYHKKNLKPFANNTILLNLGKSNHENLVFSMKSKTFVISASTEYMSVALKVLYAQMTEGFMPKNRVKKKRFFFILC